MRWSHDIKIPFCYYVLGRVYYRREEFLFLLKILSYLFSILNMTRFFQSLSLEKKMILYLLKLLQFQLTLIVLVAVLLVLKMDMHVLKLLPTPYLPTKNATLDGFHNDSFVLILTVKNRLQKEILLRSQDFPPAMQQFKISCLI